MIRYPKKLNIGFIVLVPEHNASLLRYTVNSIKARYSCPIIAITEDTAINLQELNTICPSYKADKTFSSLINVGFKKTTTEWNFIVIAGVCLRSRLDHKFSLFVDNDKDILYPIANWKTNFVEATINGLFINKKTFLEVGDMPILVDSFEEAKAEWGMNAIEKGCKFKAIIGSKII